MDGLCDRLGHLGLRAAWAKTADRGRQWAGGAKQKVNLGVVHAGHGVFWMGISQSGISVKRRQSGRHIGHQLHFQQRNMVFQLQFALLEAAQLQLIVVAVKNQHVDDCIEVAVFHIELDKTAPDFFCISHGCPDRLFQHFNCARGVCAYNHHNHAPQQHFTLPCAPISVHSLIYVVVAAKNTA
jgi:hypothetical protein